MINLLKWLFFPIRLGIGGDDGGGDSASANMIAEENRKAALRKRIDQMYGIDDPNRVAPTKDKFQRVIDPGQPGVMSSDDGGGPMYTGGREAVTEMDEPAYLKALEDFESGADNDALAARTAMDAENTQLSNAVRSYHTDDLGRDYAKAERNTRFKLARQGLLGGSEDIYQQGDVSSDRDLGATRVDEAVRRAVANLKTQREQERLSSVNLVNSGAGDSAVSAAQAGLRNSFDTANSAQKQDLFGDLFANTADAVSSSNIADQQAALLGRYRDQLSFFSPTRSSTSGRITPSA